MLLRLRHAARAVTTRTLNHTATTSTAIAGRSSASSHAAAAALTSQSFLAATAATAALSDASLRHLARTLSTASSGASYASRSRLAALTAAADAAPSDPARQYQLLKEANRLGDHAFVIARVESGRYGVNPSVRFEYNKAQQAQQAQLLQAQRQQEALHYQQHTQQAFPSATANANANYYQQHATPQYDPNGFGSSPQRPLIVREVMPSIAWSESFFSALPRLAVLLALWGLFAWMQSKDKDAKGGDSTSIFSNPFGPQKDFLNREMSTVRFADVKGCDEAKAELEEIVEFLKNPTKFERLGGKMTKGVLLTGEPGTGKTLLAKAVAGEAGVPFYSASGAEFDEMFVGVGAKRIRDLFAAARKQKRAIIFIDEIDAIGGSRANILSTHGRGTINALLTEMDGFNDNGSIVVIGATNLDRVLDPALVRPGRFDRRVVVNLPDARGRFEILELYAKKLKLHPEVDLKLLSQATSGMSGADLNNLLNTAAIRASAQNKTNIDHDEIEYAYDKILMGAERSFTQSPEVKANTAYHEAGHTIVLLNTPGASELHKVTILPRGRALGAMFSLPPGELRIRTKEQLLARLDVCMGGRVAEELLNGKDQITSGASNDLEQASQLARQMVTVFGMGSQTGVFTLPQTREGTQVVAPETLKMIDTEVAQILKESYERTMAIVKAKETEWRRLAQALIEHEVLDAKQVMQAIRGEPVTKKAVRKFRAEEYSNPPTPPPSSSDEPTRTPGKPEVVANKA